MDMKVTYLGGATFLIEVGDMRMLTDPGFDPEGTEESEGPGHDLKKVMSPPVAAEDIGPIDAVLLSHQQHYDNLDNTGRAMLPQWGKVITTPESAEALGDVAESLETWETTALTNDAGQTIRITGTPAVHAQSPEIQAATGAKKVFPAHLEGWMHYREGRDGIARAFEEANLSDRLEFPPLGEAVSVDV